MSKHYKLIIENKHKKIIQENLSDYSLDDVKTFLSDIYKITTNTVAATAISVGAQLEHAVLTTHGWNHFDLTFINETFLKKIEEANKLYNESIPQSVKGEVEYLAAIDNPSLFVGKKLLEFALFDKGKNLDMYVPFYSFIKRNFSGEFFKTDIVKFGEWLGGIVKLNNIVWYIGWISEDIMSGAKVFMQQAMEKGLLSKTGIKGLQNITTADQLINEYPDVALFIKAFDAFQVITGSNRTYYGFLKRNEKRLKEMMYYSSMIEYHRKGGFYISLKRAYETIENNKKELETETDEENRKYLQDEINELQEKYKNFLTKKFLVDPNNPDTSGYTIDEIEKQTEKINQYLIQIYETDEDGEVVTVIDNIISQAKSDMITTTDAKTKKQEKLILDSLISHREYLRQKYVDLYGKENFDKSKMSELTVSIDIIRAVNADISKETYEQLDPNVERKKILDAYLVDLKKTSTQIADLEINLFPNLIKVTMGDDFQKQLTSTLGSESKKAFNVLNEVFGAFMTDARKKVPILDDTMKVAEYIKKYVTAIIK